MSGGWYCSDCGRTYSRLPDGFVVCARCGSPGLRGYDNARPKRITCPDHPDWRGWDDGGVNDDLGAHRRRLQRDYEVTQLMVEHHAKLREVSEINRMIRSEMGPPS